MSDLSQIPPRPLRAPPAGTNRFRVRRHLARLIERQLLLLPWHPVRRVALLVMSTLGNALGLALPTLDSAIDHRVVVRASSSSASAYPAEPAGAAASEKLALRASLADALGSAAAVAGPVFGLAKVGPTTFPITHRLDIAGLSDRAPDAARAHALVAGALQSALGRKVSTVTRSAADGSVSEVDLTAQVSDELAVTVATVRTEASPPSHLRLCVSVDLDSAAMAKYAIADRRWMWSADPRFERHFSREDVAAFVPFSLFPTAFDYMNTLFVTPDFDEPEFAELARDVAGLALTALVTEKRGQHEQLGVPTAILRVFYSSVDGALSKRETERMMLRTRRHVKMMRPPGPDDDQPIRVLKAAQKQKQKQSAKAEAAADEKADDA